MGAGRKTQTIWLKEKPGPQVQGTSNFSTSARNLRKNDLGGVIFGCKHSTIKECYFKQLFGELNFSSCYMLDIYIYTCVCDKFIEFKVLKY